MIDRRKIEEWKALSARLEAGDDLQYPKVEGIQRVAVLAAAVPALLREREELRAVLREVMWKARAPGWVRNPHCVGCDCSEGYEHASDCKVQRALRGW